MLLPENYNNCMHYTALASNALLFGSYTNYHFNSYVSNPLASYLVTQITILYTSTYHPLLLKVGPKLLVNYSNNSHIFKLYNQFLLHKW